MPIIRADEIQGGHLKGVDCGATTSLILDHSEPGQGPRLHRHPYDESWVVQEGNLTFYAGDDRHQVGPGDVIVVPPAVPHKFVNNGPGCSSMVCIHASPDFITEWLE